MKAHLFQTLAPSVEGNRALRDPQRVGFTRIRSHYTYVDAEREVGIILPVGCGKSGLIAIAPFAVKSARTLVVAPGTRIAEQLLRDFDYNSSNLFYRRCHIIEGDEFPEASEIRGTQSNLADLQVSDVVITNIQQLQGAANRWLTSLPPDFFDLVLVD